MTINPIARSYWRLIKAGTRTLISVPANVRPSVMELAKQDVDNNIITPEQYKEFIGLDYIV